MQQSEEFLIRDLLEAKLVDDETIEQARAHALNSGYSISESLVAIGATTTRDLAIARALMYEFCYVELDHFDLDLSLAQLLPKALAEKHQALPLFNIDGVVTVGMANPMDFKAVDKVRAQLGGEMSCVLCESVALSKLISRAYSVVQSEVVQRIEPRAIEDAAPGSEPIVEAVRLIIAGAIDSRASDVHINADHTKLHLRYRVDGVLRPQQGPPLSTHGPIVRRLKVMAGMDLTQTRKPQDGKFRFRHLESDYDVRCSIIPTISGEAVVLRILRPDNSFASFDDLGMTEHVQRRFLTALDRPHGLILVTGPTGSGKTSTLYTAIGTLNTPDRNIMTVEDPVEIRLPLVRQTQVSPQTGLTFGAALRSILRQDPDVILVGEIRDDETALTAVQASLTGHLVLATLHTNDAVGAIDRLIDLGAPPFAVGGSLLCCIAQRLVRRLCDSCAEQYTPDELERSTFDLPMGESRTRRPVGCRECQGAGYRGRIGVYELLQMSAEIQRAIHDGAGAPAIRAIARQQGMRPLLEDGMAKALGGATSLDELFRVRATIDEAQGATQEEDREAVRLSA